MSAKADHLMSRFGGNISQVVGARAEAPANGSAECAVHLGAQAAAPKAADRVG